MNRLVWLFALTAFGAQAQAVRSNPGFHSQVLARNDDLSTPLQDIGFEINFFGNLRSAAYVNNNGNITFDASLATFTPFGLTGTQREIIAAFFADVDTRGSRSSLVRYGKDTVNGRRAFGVNYLDVGYFASHDDKLNNFQLILIDRSDTGDGNFDIEFNYDRIVWETGDASGGANGFGGTPAAVGWSNGTGLPGTSFELSGSLISGSFLDRGSRGLIRNRLNSATRGRYVFRAREGAILPPLTISGGSALPNGSIGVPYSFHLTSIGGMAPFRWSLEPDPGTALPGLSLTADGELAGTPATTGTFFFTVTHIARGDEGEEMTIRRMSLTVDPPVLRVTSACPLPQGIVGTPYFQTFQATGSEGPLLWSFSAESSLVPGLTLTPDGQLSGVPSAPGTHTFTVRVSSGGADEAAPASRSCRLTINAPVLDLTSSCEVPPATLGVPYSQTLAVTGGRGPYVWTISGGLPTGLHLRTDGNISGAPNAAGSFPFYVTVTDSSGEPSTRQCNLIVNAPVLSLSNCPLPAATTGVEYSQALSATGGTGPYRWSLIGALPGGLELKSDGVVKGAPYNAGPFLFRLLVTDAQGNSAAHPCSLTVVRAPLSLSSCPMPNARVGVFYSRLLSVAGGEMPHWFFPAGPLPEGLSLTLNGLLRGTPAKAGSFSLSLNIRDGAGKMATQSCALSVDASALRITTACPLPEARLGQPYSHQLAIDGGVKPVQFSALGRLPGGLMLQDDGALAGTAAEKGNFSFTVRAADSQGQATTTECSVTAVLPELPEIRVMEVAPSFNPASAGPVAGVELGRPYSLPIQGVLNLGVSADTGTFEFELDRPDPRLRFDNGQRTVRFTIPAGTQNVQFPLSTTGTVASAVTINISELQVLSNRLIIMPPAERFRVNKTPPVVSSACYVPKVNEMELVLSGYTPTRELTSADVSFSRAPRRNITISVVDAAMEWFVTDEAVRHGGAFTLSLPVEVIGTAAELGEVSVTLSNRQGAAAPRMLGPCQQR